jgi:CheY-like chemotaxis protein
MTGSGLFAVESLRGVWILVIDADPHGRQTLVEILSYCGALVTPLGSPAEALAVMRQVKPDVLIVSVTQSSDFTFIRLVRALKPEEGGVVPAIAVGTADSPSDDTVRSRGFQRFFRKPLDPWALCRTVSELVTMQ